MRSPVTASLLLRWFVLPALLVALAPVSVLAQITVSNLSQANNGTTSVTSNIWQTMSFTTDNSAASWTLGSVTVNMSTAGNTSGNFFVRIYSDNAGEPGSVIETLTGSADPATSANYTYTSGGSTTLLPNTTYWVLEGVSSGEGAYQWFFSSSTSETNTGGASWLLGDELYYTANSGSSWGVSSVTPNLMSVSTASAIPEPSTSAALFSLAALGFVAWRRKKLTRVSLG